MIPDWLEIREGYAPLIVSFPHTGTEIPAELAGSFVSEWWARRDADWWVDRLYDFAHGMGATTVRTRISRSVIDVNRDPSGASLYPGQATTELCPTTTFDGESLYKTAPSARCRRDRATARELFRALSRMRSRRRLARLRRAHPRVVHYDAHSIRSRIPRLFDGELPQFNIGTNDGRTCAPELAQAVEAACAAAPYSRIVDGRFKGGWTTRHYGRPRGRRARDSNGTRLPRLHGRARYAHARQLAHAL